MCGSWEVLSMAYCLECLNSGMIYIWSRECLPKEIAVHITQNALGCYTREYSLNDISLEVNTSRLLQLNI